MAVNSYDFELNGVGYNAAEDAEGDHYSVSGEPLRPPNAVSVQGERSQKFQMRPDTLLWTLTDWSAGEGQQKYSAQTPNRHRELTGVRVFEKPGTLRPGYATEDTVDNGGSSVLVKSLTLVKAKGNLYGFDMNLNEVYLWNGSLDKWGAAATLTGPTLGANPYASGDSDFVYWIEFGTNNVWKWDGTTATKISDALIDATETSQVVQSGAYVYVYDPTSPTVWEILKSGSGEAAIDEWVEEGLAIRSNSAMTVHNGRIYVMIGHSGMTIIREITPSSAAGTGFGAEIARLPGFRGEGLWSHSGLLYMTGDFGSGSEPTVMYLDPNARTYGTLGRMREEDQSLKAVHDQAATALEHHFAFQIYQPGVLNLPGIWQFDAVSGGAAIVMLETQSGLAGQTIGSIAQQAGDFFLSTGKTASQKVVIRAIRSSFTTGTAGSAGDSSQAVSAWHDFDLADEKILASLVLSTESLPADWTVYVDYAIDGATSWTTGITYTTTAGKGTKVAISTDSSTKKFRTLSIRIRFAYGGGGVPSTAPVVRGVDVLAMVAKPTKVWRILLDLSDDRSGRQGWSGAKKLANIKTATELQSVVRFKDGYGDRAPGIFTDEDVIIDSYAIMLSTPGEGVAAVVLKELA
jgi:hypothetical protein